MAKKKTAEKEIDPKRLITAEFNVAALHNDLQSLAERVRLIEDELDAKDAAPWWRRLFRCH